MALKYISLELFPDAFYEYSVALQGVSYSLQFIYNERCELYFLSLLTADNELIVSSMAMVPDYPILKDYATFPLTGFFWLEEKAEIKTQPYKRYPDAINQYYNFFYIYESED